MICFGHVKDGKLTLTNRKAFDTGLTEFEGQRVEVEVKKAKTLKTNSQLGYLWAVVYREAIIGFEGVGEYGLTDKDVHKFFKRKYLPSLRKMPDPETGQLMDVDPSLSTLSREDMALYINTIIKFCAEFLGIAISPSNKELTN